MIRGPWRKIVSYRSVKLAHSPGFYPSRWVYLLECGHQLCTKYSVPVPFKRMKKRCWRCA